MIIFLHGLDSYRRSERLNLLREAFKKKFDEQGHNVARIDGENFSINDFHKHTKSAGLFSAKRFIAFKNLWQLNKDQQAELLEELDGIDEDTILCVSADKPPRKNNKLYKRLLKAETAEEYPELNDGQLSAFVNEQVAKHNASIEPAALQHLVASIGNDLWRLASEIKKLSAQSPQISEQSVKQSVDKALNDNIFNLTDALGAKNASLATDLLNQQFEIGANEQYLLTMLARQISILLKVKKTSGQGLKLHPYVIQKSTEQARQFEEQHLLDLYWQLLEIDQKLKTSSANPRLLLDLFIIEACRA